MQLEWGTLLEQARANHAQARANQATAEATLVAMRRTHGEWDGQDDELGAWFSDAHGVAEVARVLVANQGGTKEELGRRQADVKAGGVAHDGGSVDFSSSKTDTESCGCSISRSQRREGHSTAASSSAPHNGNGSSKLQRRR